MVKVSVSAECIIAHMLIAWAKVRKTSHPAIRFSAIEDIVSLLYYKAKAKNWDMDCFWISRNIYQHVVQDNDCFMFTHGFIRLARGTSIQVLKEKFCSYLLPEIHDFIQAVADDFYLKRSKK